MQRSATIIQRCPSVVGLSVTCVYCDEGSEARITQLSLLSSSVPYEYGRTVR